MGQTENMTDFPKVEPRTHYQRHNQRKQQVCGSENNLAQANSDMAYCLALLKKNTRQKTNEENHVQKNPEVC